MQEAIRFLSNVDINGNKEVQSEMIYRMGSTPVGKREI